MAVAAVGFNKLLGQLRRAWSTCFGKDRKGLSTDGDDEILGPLLEQRLSQSMMLESAC